MKDQERKNQENNVVEETNSKNNFFGKIIFCIIVFNIVIRVDLWISIGLFFFIALYLTQTVFVKKIQDYLKTVSFQSVIDKTVNFTKTTVQQKHKEEVKQQKSASETVPPIVVQVIVVEKETSSREVNLEGFNEHEGFFSESDDEWPSENK